MLVFQWSSEWYSTTFVKWARLLHCVGTSVINSEHSTKHVSRVQQWLCCTVLFYESEICVHVAVVSCTKSTVLQYVMAVTVSDWMQERSQCSRRVFIWCSRGTKLLSHHVPRWQRLPAFLTPCTLSSANVSRSVVINTSPTRDSSCVGHMLLASVHTLTFINKFVIRFLRK